MQSGMGRLHYMNPEAAYKKHNLLLTILYQSFIPDEMSFETSEWHNSYQQENMNASLGAISL